MIKSVFQSCIDSGKYRHIFQGEILTETCSEVRCFGVVNFCLFVTHAGAGQWLRAGPALSKSPWGLIIVTFGCDDSHPRICFMWLHSEQPICVPASGFCIFVILCHLSSQRFENLKNLLLLHNVCFWKVWLMSSIHRLLMRITSYSCKHFLLWNKWCFVLPTFSLGLREHCSLRTSILDLFNGWVLSKTRCTNWKVFSH